MKYDYNKNLTETEATKPFLRTMARLDQIHETIKICNGFDDGKLIEELEGKQYRLIQNLTRGYKVWFGIEASYTVGELCDAGCLMYAFSQQNITSIEEQIMGL